MKALLIDSAPPRIAWCECELPECSESRRSGHASPDELPALFDSVKPDIIAYALHHGGTSIRQLASRVDDLLLERLTHTVPLMPDHNALTVDAVRFGKSYLPTAKHYLLCDSAVFAEMPEEATVYAVPPKLRSRGIRRYGLNGLAHRRALERARALSRKSLTRVITVFIASQSSVAAFDGDSPRDTSSGFTPVEGLIAISSCGDIDPTVALHMVASGMNFRDVQRLLTQESGLRALAADPELSFADLLRDAKEEKHAFARSVWIYQLTKTIGSLTAVLGGVDAISFTGAPDVDVPAVVVELAPKLAPLQIKLSAKIMGAEVTAGDSPVKLFTFTNDRWQNLAVMANRLIERGV